MEDPIFLDLKYILEAHRDYFGRELACDHGSIDSAVNSAVHAYCYSSEPLDLFEFAGIYACNISAAHAFADGNKRTALLAATGFLAANGIDIEHYDQDNLADWLTDVANKAIDRRQFARRLRCASGLSVSLRR